MRSKARPSGVPRRSPKTALSCRSRRLVLFLSLLCLSLALPLPSSAATAPDQADDLTEKSLEELMDIPVATVYGASRFEQKVTDAPASVSIVTGEEIRKYGYRTLADVLRSVRGVYVTNDRNYSYLGVRGFNRPGDYNTRILLLVDGHRINDNIYDQAPIGLEFPVDVDLIDRIEFIRGPSSSLYGANAFFGVINIFTLSPQGMGGAELSASAASRDTYSGRLSYGNRFGNAEGLLSGSIYTSAGDHRLFYREYADPSTNYGYAVNADGEDAAKLFGKFSFRDLTLSGAYSTREKHIPTGSFGTVFNDNRTRTTDEHSYLDLNYSHAFDSELQFTGRLFYDRYNYHGDYAYDLADFGLAGVTAVNRDQAFGEWWGAEAQLTRTCLTNHKLTLGAEYRGNLTQQQKNFYDDPSLPLTLLTPILNDTRSSDVWAVFFQDEFHLLDDLILNAGVRYDHYDTFGGTVNPRAGLIYRPWQTSALKFLYGEAFRAPNAYELYYNDGGVSLKSNPDLQPEKIRTGEVVYEQYLGEHLRSSVSGFYYRITDLISQQVDPRDSLLVFRNVDQVDAKGAELELEGTWPGGLQGRVSYTYQDATDLGTQQQLTNSPRNLAKLNVIVPLVEGKLFAGTELQYVGSRKTLANGVADPYLVVNLTLFSKELLKGLELSASVYNLFATGYGDPGSAEHLQDVISQEGRRLRAKLTYRF